jgi:hypothetical protein
MNIGLIDDDVHKGEHEVSVSHVKVEYRNSDVKKLASENCAMGKHLLQLKEVKVCQSIPNTREMRFYL